MSSSSMAPPARPPPPPSGAPPPVRKVSSSLDLSQLPSVKDGSCKTTAEELLKRRKTCRFIEEAGRQLKLPQVCKATAMVLFHRFYAKHSFAQHDRFEVAVACLLLAAKTEESPRKLNVVLQECYRLKHQGRNSAGSAVGGKSPLHGNVAGMLSASSSPSHGLVPPLDPKGEEFVKLKERILLLERVILHTIGFELSIDHPYKFLVDLVKRLGRQLEHVPKVGPPIPLSGKLTNELVQYAMNFANDSMHTTLCLQYPARIVAMGCVYLSGQYCKIRPQSGKSWLEALGDITVEDLTSVSLQIMELVAEKRGPSADPKTDPFAKVKADLELMRHAKRSGSTTVPSPKRPRVN
jgi:cyclin T